MAHTKAQGSSSNGRDSHGQRLGVKRFGSQFVHAGEKLSSAKKAPNSCRVRTLPAPAMTAFLLA